MNLASIPSPSSGVWHLGPLPIRAYALLIIVGVIVGAVLTERRWVARGGRPGTIIDLASVAVPAGLVGARLYHVITDPELYFGAGKHPIRALYVWEGGLGIWGAVAGGALGVYVVARRRRISFAALADATAPGIAVAQAVGRWGNYFNQELFGRSTTLPWGLRIAPEHRPAGSVAATYQPTFLYESLWDLGVAGLVIWADRRWQLGRGRAFALYVAAYTVGRAWIEALRVDPANHFLGLRLNDYVSIAVFVVSATYLLRRRGAREEQVEPPPDDDSAPPMLERDADQRATAS